MRQRPYPRHPVPAEGATLADGTAARRFALTGWLSVCCGLRSPAGRRPVCECDEPFAVRVDVLDPVHVARLPAQPTWPEDEDEAA